MYLFDKRILSKFDYLLIIFIIPLILLSYNLISDVNDKLADKQITYFSISFLIFIILFLFPLRQNIRWIPFFYWLGILLLVAVEFFGVSKLGAQRWLEVPFLGTTIQPSELFKPIFILMLGYLIQQNPPEESGYKLKDFLKLSFYILLPFLLIAKEPDLGTALVLLFVGYGILFIIGVSWKIWITIILAISFSSPFIYTYLIKDYQKKRITDFISEEPSYHVRQSIIAIGSGGIHGKDPEDATQTQLKFLPIATSDFIFAYYIERHGFIGGVILLLIYLALIAHLLSVNYYFKGEYIIKILGTGIGLLIFFNMSVNILMVIGFAPVVGLPLPLFSYGGSSFINFIALIAIFQHFITFQYINSYDE